MTTTLSPQVLGLSDRTLVRFAARDDGHAWDLLHRRFDASIHAVARRHGLNEADRDDVAQRTWLAFHRHVGTLETHPSIAGWLCVTARHESLRVLGRAKREIPVEEIADAPEPDPTEPDRELLAAERSEALRRALDRVPTHQRRLMRLLLHEPPLSYDEISAALGSSRGYIGPTRARCIALLREDRILMSQVGA